MLQLTLPQYRALRRLHGWTAIVPVGAFVVFHILVNASVLAGAARHQIVARTLEALPFRLGLEWLGIGLPILAHVALGILLGNSNHAFAENPPYRRHWMQPFQRAAGGYLVFFVIFHAWSTRFSPEIARGRSDFFHLLEAQLRNPAVLALYCLGVAAAAAHLGLGLLRVLGTAQGAAPSRRVEGMVLGLALAIACVGVNALLGFVHGWARWLEAPATLSRGLP